jgi:branched-chain amino acid transport system ATP-binding protein
MTSSAADSILSVHGVSKTFGGLAAVADCSASIRRGSITGLIGPNGAGKTTLFNLITGHTRPDSGHIYLDGRRIDRLAPHRVFRHGLVRTFQIPRPFESMSVVENLMLVPPSQAGESVLAGMLASRRTGREEEANFHKACEVLELVGLDALRDESAGHLSGGQKKLLELGRSLMCEPNVILLDEPAAGVNPTLSKKLMQAVKELQATRGMTFLVIEHDMNLIAENCDSVIVMTNGSVLMTGTPTQVKSDPRVLAAYLGDPVAMDIEPSQNGNAP